MLAETAFNVIEALSEEEKKRLFVMLGVHVSPPKPKKKPLITDAQAKEYLIKKLKIKTPMY